MAYYPPNVAPQSLPAGLNEVYLMGLKTLEPEKLAKFGAQVVYVATFKSVETAIEMDAIIKFCGTRADFYAGQTIDRLHLAAGLPEPVPGEEIDISPLLIGLSGVPFTIEINDKGYFQQVVVNAPATDGEEPAF